MVYTFYFVILLINTRSSSFYLDKWNIDTPALKTDKPLCVSFRGIDKLCSVNIDGQIIYSDAVQNGSIRVYALGTLCKLCLHNFHLDNHTIHKQIQVDEFLNRIAVTSLRDIVKTGLVGKVYIIHNCIEKFIICATYTDLHQCCLAFEQFSVYNCCTHHIRRR